MTVVQLVDAQVRDLGDGVAVARALPQLGRRTVGPFVFFDHFGPIVHPPGHGLDVRPHPHIGLATVTWLFDGEITHRDSLGTHQVIRPGEVNWMTAGRGIVHSERTSPAARAAGGRVHGLQAWVALPLDAEEVEPAFAHHGADEIGAGDVDGATLSVVAGTAYGHRSPVRLYAPLFYAIATLPAGGRLAAPTGHAERAIYVVDGSLTVDGVVHGAHRLLVLGDGEVVMSALAPTRVALFGGDPLDGPRHLLWNFVSSSRARLARARDDWKAGRFPPVSGDDGELVPFPD